jgi:hypothetical protein
VARTMVPHRTSRMVQPSTTHENFAKWFIYHLIMVSVVTGLI